MADVDAKATSAKDQKIQPVIPVFRGNDGVLTSITVARPLPIISTAHTRIHQGLGYVCGTYSAAVANNANLDMLIQVADARMHTILDVAAGGDTTITMYEGTTFSSAGSSLSAFNKARWSDNTTTTTLTAGPTITDIGTAFPTKFLPGGTRGNAQGGSDSGFSRELDFSTSTNYLIRAVNISGNSKPISIVLEWYEVP